MTNSKSVVEEIDVPGYWEGPVGLWVWPYAMFYHNKRVHCQLRDYLYIPRILSIQNTISREIER